MSEERCGLCRFLFGAKGEWGQCRRYPPQIYAIAKGDGDDVTPHVSEAWPETYKGAWCGEFKEAKEDHD